MSCHPRTNAAVLGEDLPETLSPKWSFPSECDQFRKKSSPKAIIQLGMTNRTAHLSTTESSEFITWLFFIFPGGAKTASKQPKHWAFLLFFGRREIFKNAHAQAKSYKILFDAIRIWHSRNEFFNSSWVALRNRRWIETIQSNGLRERNKRKMTWNARASQHKAHQRSWHSSNDRQEYGRIIWIDYILIGARIHNQFIFMGTMECAVVFAASY